MHWLKCKSQGLECFLVPCFLSVKIGGKKIKSWHCFVLHFSPPGHSVFSSIDLLLMLLVDVARSLSHAQWYKILSQLSLCSNFGLQILVRQDRWCGDQGLVTAVGWGENKCIVLLFLLSRSIYWFVTAAMKVQYISAIPVMTWKMHYWW